MAGINKVVSDSLKDIIINPINKIRSIKKDSITKQFFSFIITNSAENYEQEFIDSALNYMVRHNMITNCPNSKGDSYIVNSQNKLTDDMQKECNSGTENESNMNLERLSNIEVEERSPSSPYFEVSPDISRTLQFRKFALLL